MRITVTDDEDKEMTYTIIVLEEKDLDGAIAELISVLHEHLR